MALIRPHILQGDETLCFLHIPKTAGLTLRSILDQHFALQEICPADNWRSLRALPPGQLSRYRLVRGHFPFGVGEHLPRRPVYATLLRDPVERVLSQYDYVRRDTSNGPLHEMVRAMTLEEYLDDEFLREETIHDIQTRYLAPATVMPDDIDVVAPVRHTGVVRAKTNLQQCAFVGLTERMHDSVRLLAYTFGWRRRRTFQTQNVALARPQRADVPARVIDKILSCNTADQELYAFGCALFQERVDQMVDELLDRQQDHVPRQPPAAAGHLFVRFDSPIHGEGWYPAETDASGRAYRWMGPGRQASVELTIAPGGDRRIQLRVAHAPSTEILESLTVTINNTRLKLETDEDVHGTVFSGIVPASVLPSDHGPSRLVFEVSHTIRPCNIATDGNQDSRPLGIALAWIHVSSILERSPNQPFQCG